MHKNGDPRNALDDYKTAISHSNGEDWQPLYWIIILLAEIVEKAEASNDTSTIQSAMEDFKKYSEAAKKALEDRPICCQ